MHKYNIINILYVYYPKFRSIEITNAVPLARISEPTPLRCKQALDAGAKGVIAPMIETSEQIK